MEGSELEVKNGFVHLSTALHDATHFIWPHYERGVLDLTLNLTIREDKGAEKHLENNKKLSIETYRGLIFFQIQHFLIIQFYREDLGRFFF